MLNTSSSEDDDYDLPSGGTRNNEQISSGWRQYEYSGWVESILNKEYFIFLTADIFPVFM